jgi:hypothetical protein
MQTIKFRKSENQNVNVFRLKVAQCHKVLNLEFENLILLLFVILNHQIK